MSGLRRDVARALLDPAVNYYTVLLIFLAHDLAIAGIGTWPSVGILVVLIAVGVVAVHKTHDLRRGA